MYDTSFVAVVYESEKLPHHGSCSCLIKILLFFEDAGQGLSVFVLEHDEETMVIFEKFIDFGYRRMIDFFEFVDLFLKLLSLVAAYFVFIDDVDCSCEGGFDVDGFPQLIELVLLEAGWEQFILIFDAAFDFFDKIGLLELYVVFGVSYGDCWFLLDCGCWGIAHIY